MYLNVSLIKTNNGTLDIFLFARACTVPSTVLHLFADQVVLNNIQYLVTDNSTTFEDLLIELSFLRHLRVVKRMLFEDKIGSKHGTDCSLKGAGTMQVCKLGILTTARLNGVSNVAPEVILKYYNVNYHMARTEEDPFLDQSLLDRTYQNHHI